MNLFTENQVNHVYPLTPTSNISPAEIDPQTNAVSNVPVSDLEHLGDLALNMTPDKRSIYFLHKGPGGVTRSDLIDINKIMWINATPAAKMRTPLYGYTVRLDPSALDGGNVIPNKDYILRIELTNYIGVSPEDSHYWKYGMVHTTANMTPADFYKALAKSILKNMSREAVKFLAIHNGTTEVTLSNVDSQTFSRGILITEVEPEWTLGLKKQKVIHFNLTGIPFDNDGEDIYWLSGEDEEHELSHLSGDEGFNNSKITADYEYFFHGERGDQYRMTGWPDYIHTTYLVNPDWAYGYDYVQLHYCYVGPNEGMQRSEKDITFLIPSNAQAGGSLSEHAAYLMTRLTAVAGSAPRGNEEPNTNNGGKDMSNP